MGDNGPKNPVTASSTESPGEFDGPSSSPALRRHGTRRRNTIAVAAVLVAVGIVTVSLFVESLPSEPKDVTVNGTIVSVNYTNLPAGHEPPSEFWTFFAWFNASGEFPNIQSFQAPAGSLAILGIIVSYVGQTLGVSNCSFTSVSAAAPFSITSVSGHYGSSASTSNPFPLNFSGATPISGATANLLLNVTMPEKNGAYTPTFALAASCEEY